MLVTGVKGQQEFNLIASKATGVKYWPFFFFFFPLHRLIVDCGEIIHLLELENVFVCTRDRTLKRAVIIRQHSYVIYIV